MWRKICAQSPVGRLEFGIKELQEVFQKISEDQVQTKSGTNDKPPELWRYPTTNLSDPEDISSPKIQKEYKSLEERPPTSKA